MSRRPANVATGQIRIYYTKLDGATEVPYTTSLRAGADTQSVALVATAQALAGPPPSIEALRFPQGTHPLSVTVRDRTALVDLSGEVKQLAATTLEENGAMKSLVWTLTDLPGIDAVRIRVDGTQVATLPGGHLELDEPLTRSNW